MKLTQSLSLVRALAAANAIFLIICSSAALAQNKGFCSNGPEPSPSPIVSGQKTKFSVFYECFDNQGNPVADTVTIQMLSKLPKGADFQPGVGTSNADNGTTVTITTSKSTPPGTYNLNVGGKGSACPTYSNPPCQYTFQIKPTITSKDNKSAVWWFNGEQPSGFTHKLELTAHPEGEAKYTWKVDDDTYGDITDKGSNPTHFKTTCQAGQLCPPASQGRVMITVTGNGVPSDPFPASVLTPYQAIPQPVPPDNPDTGAGALFYFSHIPYQITDQFGKPLPKKPPVREHFTAEAQNQCTVTVAGLPVPCNWHRSSEGGSGEAGRLGSTGCSVSGPGIVCDTISGQAKNQALGIPSIPTPECPNNNCSSPSTGSSTLKVLCFPGELWVGNGASPPTPPAGVRIMTLIWERYQDHARHCNILSPLDGSGNVIDACTCP
jgi:hypothetical protein